ncbi:MAG TPA: hypothetical protein VFQ53_12295 [Kofleriaceae bacterium]|nr:hypothetical protein [Kofleriaceae bacterium]
MQFADPQELSTAYLILRHLYDGDVIEWPIADDHPAHGVFAALEAQGYIARWDRLWPMRDRYRLTDKGIATIESMYKPAGADAFFDDLRNQNLSPADRRSYLQTAGYDPTLWPLLHDPSTHWDTYRLYGSRYHDYIWEDQRPLRRKRQAVKQQKLASSKPLKTTTTKPVKQTVVRTVRDPNDPLYVPYLVDLDREASSADADVSVSPAQPDYDVS